MIVKRAIFLFFSLIGLYNAGFAQNTEGNAFYNEVNQPEKLVQLYPNPATDYIAVRLQHPHANSVKLSMHSVIGNSLNVEREQVDDFEVRLRVKDLPSGYYFLSIKDEESGLKATYKFLKR